MKKKFAAWIAGSALAAVLALGITDTIEARGNGNPLPQPVVYVTSQGLYYDSLVPTDLPRAGRFQKLEPTAGPHGSPQTEFGPGDQAFVGGRWWVDVDANNMMDDTDVYFLCPLLGPGRETL